MALLLEIVCATLALVFRDSVSRIFNIYNIYTSFIIDLASLFSFKCYNCPSFYVHVPDYSFIYIMITGFLHSYTYIVVLSRQILTNTTGLMI